MPSLDAERQCHERVDQHDDGGVAEGVLKQPGGEKSRDPAEARADQRALAEAIAPELAPDSPALPKEHDPNPRPYGEGRQSALCRKMDR